MSLSLRRVGPTAVALVGLLLVSYSGRAQPTSRTGGLRPSAPAPRIVSAAYSVPTIVSVPMTKCCPENTVAVGGNVYALLATFGGPERSDVVRIDPSTNMVTGRISLPSGLNTGDVTDASGITVADGSLWVTQYWHNQVLRIDPATMRLTARIATGRSPGSIAHAGSAVWVAEQTDGTLARIDPATNSITARVRVGAGHGGTDYAYQLAYDGSQVLVSLPTSGRVARVNPSTLRVQYDAVGTTAAQCARILPAAGGYWLDDTQCGFDYFRWDNATGAITADVNPFPGGDYGGVVVGSALYTAQFPRDGGAGYIVKYDAQTGAQLGQITVGDDAELPSFAHGSLWVGNWTDQTLVRLPLF